MISADYAKEALDYNPETGDLVWRERPLSHFRSTQAWRVSRSKSPGRVAGRKNTGGHIQIRLNGRHYMAHRIAWLIYHGSWQELQIDHKNGIPHDNRISNLRLSTQSQNSANKKTSITSSSGVLGVNWHKASGKWVAQIKVEQRVVYLGVFHTIAEAAEARKAAEKKYQGEFALSER